MRRLIGLLAVATCLTFSAAEVAPSNAEATIRYYSPSYGHSYRGNSRYYGNRYSGYRNYNNYNYGRSYYGNRYYGRSYGNRYYGNRYYGNRYGGSGITVRGRNFGFRYGW